MDEILLNINHLYDFSGDHLKNGKEGLRQKLFPTVNPPKLGSKKIPESVQNIRFKRMQSKLRIIKWLPPQAFYSPLPGLRTRRKGQPLQSS
jgi:hypothetical protein